MRYGNMIEATDKKVQDDECDNAEFFLSYQAWGNVEGYCSRAVMNLGLAE